MGFFDFFRRKKHKPPPIDLDALMSVQPRCHHYTLAHIALRTVAFDQPLAYIGVLASPDALRFLSDLMRSVSEHCRQHEAQPGFALDDVTIHRVRVGPYPCAVIQMPEPQAAAEAFFTAAVLFADLADENLDPDEITLRYFTLEKGFTIDGTERTVLCEWDAEGTHSNFGDGPPPRLELFLDAIAKFVAV